MQAYLIIRISKMSVKTCTHFACASVRIVTWLSRMAFVVIHTGITLVLGIPLYARFEPRILWRNRQFVTEQDRAGRVLSANILPHVYAQLSVTTTTKLVPALSVAYHTSSPVTAKNPTVVRKRSVARLLSSRTKSRIA